MIAWRWVAPAVVYAIHDRQLAEHGGLQALRDKNEVEYALAQPQNLAAYGAPNAADLAAGYAFGLARNHGFADGNKRSAWVIARLFLALHGVRLEFDKAEAVLMMEQVAAGSLSEPALAEWFRARHAAPDL